MTSTLSPAEEALRSAARDYHRAPRPGKISVTPTKPLVNQHDLSLAYSPGVAYPCLDIHADPSKVTEYTSRGNLVGVITNGTAVLGLGDIGPLASKPVMEGKGGLFKRFAGIDVFDIELAERDPEKLVDIICALEPTLGGINLEDIKAPECFYIEQQLSKRLNIPVFHDDQHGTAIISSAALLNALEIVGKEIGEIKMAVSGAGAAAIACLDVMVGMGVQRENITIVDSRGVVYEGRSGSLDPSKQRYARRTWARTLADIMHNADVFLGCSMPGVLTSEMLMTMASKPIILALANPEPEVRPELAKRIRPDCIIATGRSDYPNQVNNVLCFPYIFRGALDCGATKITAEMKLACVREIASLAKAEASDEVRAAYPGKTLSFGPDFLIPTPFDPRLILRIAPAVARAAEASGVAARPIEDYASYQQSLTRFVYHTGTFMQPVLAHARADARRVTFAEGEDERVLRAAQVVVDEKIAQPILIGRREVIEARIRGHGLRMVLGRDVECFDVETDARTQDYVRAYQSVMHRSGMTLADASTNVRASATLMAAMMLTRGDTDSMLCGLVGPYASHLAHVRDVVGLAQDSHGLAALNVLMLPERTLFIADTYVNDSPDAALLAYIAVAACDEVRRHGLVPRVAFLSHGGTGASDRPNALKMREARARFAELAPGVSSQYEVQEGPLREEADDLPTVANILICPNIDAANVLFNVLKMTGGQGRTVGPILLGAADSAHILTPTATVRRIINMTAIAAVRSARQHEKIRAPLPA